MRNSYCLFNKWRYTVAKRLKSDPSNGEDLSSVCWKLRERKQMTIREHLLNRNWVKLHFEKIINRFWRASWFLEKMIKNNEEKSYILGWKWIPPAEEWILFMMSISFRIIIWRVFYAVFVNLHFISLKNFEINLSWNLP